MKEHERHHKEPGSKKGKKNGNSKSFDGEHKEPPKVKSQQHIDADKDTTGRMGFSIEFWLAEGEVKGQIIHRRVANLWNCQPVIRRRRSLNS
jgi:transposase InsO family protein